MKNRAKRREDSPYLRAFVPLYAFLMSMGGTLAIACAVALALM